MRLVTVAPDSVWRDDIHPTIGHHKQHHGDRQPGDNSRKHAKDDDQGQDGDNQGIVPTWQLEPGVVQPLG